GADVEHGATWTHRLKDEVAGGVRLIPASVHSIVEVLSPARPEIAARAFGCGSRGAIHKFSPQSSPIRDRCGGACLSSRCHRMPTDRSRARHESSKPSGYGYSLLIMAHHACARPTEAQGTLVRNQSGPADLSRCTARGKVNCRFRDDHNPQELNDANSARHEGPGSTIRAVPYCLVL